MIMIQRVRTDGVLEGIQGAPISLHLSAFSLAFSFAPLRLQLHALYPPYFRV